MSAFLASLAVASLGMRALDLKVIAENAARDAIAKFSDKKVAADQIGITVAALDRKMGTFLAGSYRGGEQMYPASVVKLFYLGNVCHLIETKKVALTPELKRAIQDMIVDSNNDATALVLDTITGTTGGPELPASELRKWMDKRQSVNRWYASLGYNGMNACQKPWNEGPYGRERQGYGEAFRLRNSLSPDVCVRLMSEIALDKMVSPAQCSFMKGYLSRKIVSEGPVDDFQSKAFTGGVLPKGSKLWSKAGYTDEVRHDVAYFQAPDGREFVMAIFTKGHSDEPGLIPFIATSVFKGLGVLG